MDNRSMDHSGHGHSDENPAWLGPTPREEDLALAERMLNALRNGSDVRRRKVRRVRAAIRALAYENPLKLHVAIDRLAGDVSADRTGT